MDVPLNNVTALQDEVYQGWFSSPDTRSTTDIIWTCLATIILCVYTAVHLNIPEPGENAGWQALRRAKWVIIAILAPEIVLSAAWQQYSDAKKLQTTLKKSIRAQRDGKSSSSKTDVVHGPAADVNDDHEDTTDAQEKLLPAQTIDELLEIPNEEDITLRYAFYAIMGGFRVRLDGISLCVTSIGIESLSKEGIFWNISTAEINDKSKADSLAKVLTVLQVIWMLVQCIARKFGHLPLTLIEIHTFMHAVCAAIMFLLWFKKPLNIGDATHLPLTRQLHARIKSILPSEPETDPDKPDSLVIRQLNIGYGRRQRGGVWKGFDLWRLLLWVMSPLDFNHWTMYFGPIGVQVLYGCLHMAAWNSHFPTVLEMWFWRAACITIASSSLVVLAIIVTFSLIDNWLEDIEEASSGLRDSVISFLRSFVAVIVMFGPIPLIAAWICARFYIVVESFISLRAVPIGVYASVQWANYIPHI